MDEFTTYVKHEHAYLTAQRALASRLGLHARADMTALPGMRWRLVRRVWQDESNEELMVEFIGDYSEHLVTEIINKDPVYFVAGFQREHHQTYYVLERSLREPDHVKQCLYVVALRQGERGETFVWCARFKTFHEAEVFAYEEAMRFLDDHNIRRYDLDEVEYGRPISATNYITELCRGYDPQFFSHHSKQYTEIAISMIDEDEKYPHEPRNQEEVA